jgi:hypothetical protein
MDGSMNVLSQTTTTLFNGAIPPNGFMVQLGPQSGNICMVNDNGPASFAAGFQMQVGAGVSVIYVTPPGYKPMGQVIFGAAVKVMLRPEAGDGPPRCRPCTCTHMQRSSLTWSSFAAG